MSRRGRGGRRPWLAKLDMKNAFWSVCLPWHWPRVFILQTTNGCRYRYKWPPFGWRYSPLVCQTLVHKIVAGALQSIQASLPRYISMTFWSPQIGALIYDVRCEPSPSGYASKIGFLMSPKSGTKPVQDIRFIGKRVNTVQGAF